jgi:uncharacterized membrane protein HdeD (DUF308 family)
MAYCMKCKGMMWIVVGLVFLLNNLWLHWAFDTVLGILLVIAGIISMVKPSCGCPGYEEPKMKKK